MSPPASNQTHTFARQTSFAPPREGPRTSSSKSTKELTMWVSLVSGCAVSRCAANRVWLHNDAGNGAQVCVPAPTDARCSPHRSRVGAKTFALAIGPVPVPR